MGLGPNEPCYSDYSPLVHRLPRFDDMAIGFLRRWASSLFLSLDSPPFVLGQKVSSVSVCLLVVSSPSTSILDRFLDYQLPNVDLHFDIGDETLGLFIPFIATNQSAGGMDNNQIMSKEKLGFFQTIGAALKVIRRNPKFAVVAFFASLYLFSFSVAFDIVSRSTWIGVFESLTDFMNPRQVSILTVSGISYTHEPSLDERTSNSPQRFWISILFFFGTVHLLDLLNTIVIVYSASAIYGEKNSSSLKEMVLEPIRKVGFKGPLSTSLYALLLASLTVLGLFTLGIAFFIPFSLLFPLFPVLLVKFVEWSAIWKMGMVISILEEKHGYIALGVSAYISRGSRKRGFSLMLVFFILMVGSRLPYLLPGWNGSLFSVLYMGMYLGLNSIANVTMWVVFTVYYYDCKNRFLEKKIDVEEGKSAKDEQQQ